MENILPSYKLEKQRQRQKIKKIQFDKKINTSLGKGLTYFIKTYGCQANVRDGENLCGIVEKMGFKKAEDILNSDLVILNTCAIRENAEKKVFGEIGLLKQIKQRNKKFKFGICGCMVQNENIVEKISSKIKHVDFIFGTHNIYELPKILTYAYSTNKKIFRIPSSSNEIVEKIPDKRNDQIKAFVNIMFGCDKFCTYCVVPYARGTLKSRAKSDIIAEVKELIKKGYKEITLLGQNVNSYGIDLKNSYDFADLLEEVAQTRIERIRFSSSNPWNFTHKIVDVMAKYKNIMPHVHLPIQSGDEQILKKMNREMKIADYISLVNYIRKKVDQCAITTDLIVGFPNETKKQFLNTIKLYNKIKFDNAYTFIYSKRDNTPAAKMIDKIDYEQKQKRLEMLNEIVRKYAKINCEKWEGKVCEVLVEGNSKTNENVLTGYSPQWKVVNFTGNCKPGEIVKVKIISASRFSLNGKQIN